MTYYGIFLWLVAGGHIYQCYKHDNHNTGNGPAIWISDIVIPLADFILLFTDSHRQADQPRQPDNGSLPHPTHAAP